MKKWQKVLFGEFTWKRLLRSVLSIYVILLVIAVSLGDYFIFTPPTPSYSSEDTSIISLPSEDPKTSNIAAFFLPAKDSMPTLLWSHGNAEDIGHIRPLLKRFNTLGFGILSYDYPGYGLSEGEPSDRSCYRAADKAFSYLTNDQGIDPAHIIAVGQSIGSGPSCYLAEKENLKGLILVSPLKSVYRVAFKYPIFPRDRFPNIKRIANISEPLMIIHGDEDTVIPHSHGKAIAAKHTGETIFHTLQGKGHNNLIGSSPEEQKSYFKLFTEFSKGL